MAHVVVRVKIEDGKKWRRWEIIDRYPYVPKGRWTHWIMYPPSSKYTNALNKGIPISTKITVE